MCMQVEQHFFDTTLMPTMLKLEEPEQALLRSEGGPRAVAPFTFAAQQTLFRIESQTFRVLLLRRFCLSFPLQMRICWCGRPLDVPGHHCAACTNAGILDPRGFAVQSVVARIFPRLGLARYRLVRRAACGSGGGRPSSVLGAPNLPVPWGGMGPRGRGQQRTMVLLQTRRRAERSYPGLMGGAGQCRWVVVGGEVGGRWSSEICRFLTSLSPTNSREAPDILRQSSGGAWRRWWGGVLACSAGWASCGARGVPGADGETSPVHKADCHDRFVSFFLRLMYSADPYHSRVPKK